MVITKDHADKVYNQNQKKESKCPPFDSNNKD